MALIVPLWFIGSLALIGAILIGFWSINKRPIIFGVGLFLVIMAIAFLFHLVPGPYG